MATNKHLGALLIVASQLFNPVFAKTSDLPAFSLWAAQWAPIAGQTRVERLPCLRAAQHACSGVRVAKHRGAVDPFARPSHTMRTSRRHVGYKNTARIQANTYWQFDRAAWGRFTPTMILSDGGRRVVNINLAAADIAQPATLETLTDYVTAVAPSPPPATNLLGEAISGLGDSAYVALYDFDDSSAAGETTGGFEEITTLLDAHSTRAPATAVAEPRTWLLLGVSWFAVLACGRVKSARVGLSHAAG